MKISSLNFAEHYHWGNGCEGWHLVKTENLSVIQEKVPSGCSEIRHLHHFAEQFFFILSGVATIEAEGKVFKLEEGEGLHVPANISHQLFNLEKYDLVFTVTSTPPSHGDRVEQPNFQNV